MLWVDKHRPKSLEKLTYHPETTARLSSLAAAPHALPHLLFYGPPGAGKKTRIMCLLRAIFGPGAERLRLDKRTFTTPTNKKIDINMICSNYHIELSPGDAGRNDRFVVQDVIKEMAANRSLSASSSAGGFTAASAAGLGGGELEGKKGVGYKVVVLVEVDKLSRQAQSALRRTMEKFSSGCRLILCCNNQSKVIEPVRSRCLGIRVAAPTHDDICASLKTISIQERITLPDELATNISRASSRNMRRAALMLESAHVSTNHASHLSPTDPIKKTDWELYITRLAAEVTQEQSPQRLMAAREKLYELLINCIPASVILKTLALELLKNLDDEMKHEVMEAAAFYEHRIAMGSKDIFHLEAFLAKFMAIYKRYLNNLFA